MKHALTQCLGNHLLLHDEAGMPASHCTFFIKRICIISLIAQYQLLIDHFLWLEV